MQNWRETLFLRQDFYQKVRYEYSNAYSEEKIKPYHRAEGKQKDNVWYRSAYSIDNDAWPNNDMNINKKPLGSKPIKWLSVEPTAGFEPATCSLRMSCSTDWAKLAYIRYAKKIILHKQEKYNTGNM